MSKRFIAVVLVTAMNVFISPLLASAQDQGGGDRTKTDKTVTLDETKIQGRMQKPEAFYILQHSELNHEVFETEPTFIPELLESVEDEPF